MKRLVAAALLTTCFGCGAAPEEGVIDSPPAAEQPAPGPAVPAAPPAAVDPSTPAPAPPPPAPFDPITQITSGNGITVESVAIVSPRTFDVVVSTPEISPKAKMAKGNAVRIILPVDYATSGKRYPVLYFLHGASCNYTTVSESLGLEPRLSDVIIVTPEGGQYGFYTDWVDQSIPQKWETYHLDQLLPFVDRNLRTIAAKEGRGVMGISMGGLGAMRYAVDRPELFAAATTLSGIVDLQHALVQIAITGMLAGNGLNASGAFGPLGGPVWASANPVAHVNRLLNENVEISIYHGQGNDPAEALVASASGVLHKYLTEANIPHFFQNYGAPGDTPEGYCNGTHTGECDRYAIVDALPRMRAALANPK